MRESYIKRFHLRHISLFFQELRSADLELSETAAKLYEFQTKSEVRVCDNK